MEKSLIFFYKKIRRCLIIIIITIIFFIIWSFFERVIQIAPVPILFPPLRDLSTDNSSESLFILFKLNIIEISFYHV